MRKLIAFPFIPFKFIIPVLRNKGGVEKKINNAGFITEVSREETEGDLAT